VLPSLSLSLPPLRHKHNGNPPWVIPPSTAAQHMPPRPYASNPLVINCDHVAYGGKAQKLEEAHSRLPPDYHYARPFGSISISSRPLQGEKANFPILTLVGRPRSIINSGRNLSGKRRTLQRVRGKGGTPFSSMAFPRGATIASDIGSFSVVLVTHDANEYWLTESRSAFQQAKLSRMT